MQAGCLQHKWRAGRPPSIEALGYGVAKGGSRMFKKLGKLFTWFNGRHVTSLVNAIVLVGSMSGWITVETMQHVDASLTHGIERVTDLLEGVIALSGSLATVL